MPARQSRVLRFHSFGEPLDVLCEDHVEVADPPAGTIRVRTIATGLNPADWELCRGFLQAPLPRGVGYDVAGIVDAVGPDLSEGAPGVGDLVVGSADFARQPSAGAADVAILDAWAPVPNGLAPVEAATLPMVVQTAAWTLQAMGVHAGATILVHGAGGMVGHAAVQMALARGAHVLATAGSTYRDDLTRYGAHVTGYGAGMVERVRALPRGSHVDLVLDAARPSPGTIPDLVALAGGDPRRVMTISNHDEARAPPAPG